ncbi:hypothetical protein MHU86_19322 [Fragilaria crotonensis]|nr:hypothetical protein MHU86_19322 [Fragilaria crotonensis]
MGGKCEPSRKIWTWGDSLMVHYFVLCGRRIDDESDTLRSTATSEAWQQHGHRRPPRPSETNKRKPVEPKPVKQSTVDLEREFKRQKRDDERDTRKRQKDEEVEQKRKARADERLSRLSIQVDERLFKEACFQREKVILAMAKVSRGNTIVVERLLNLLPCNLSSMIAIILSVLPSRAVHKSSLRYVNCSTRMSYAVGISCLHMENPWSNGATSIRYQLLIRSRTP